MARPARNLSQIRTVVRRRHRSWMLAMTLATLGWGALWVTAFLRRLTPFQPEVSTAYWIGSFFAVLGLLATLWTFRARRAWLLLTMIPLFANASLLTVPIVLGTPPPSDVHAEEVEPQGD